MSHTNLSDKEDKVTHTPTRGILDLPSEVKDLIAYQLTVTDAKALARVCKGLQDSAEVVVWETITDLNPIIKLVKGEAKHHEHDPYTDPTRGLSEAKVEERLTPAPEDDDSDLLYMVSLRCGRYRDVPFVLEDHVEQKQEHDTAIPSSNHAEVTRLRPPYTTIQRALLVRPRRANFVRSLGISPSVAVSKNCMDIIKSVWGTIDTLYLHARYLVGTKDVWSPRGHISSTEEDLEEALAHFPRNTNLTMVSIGIGKYTLAILRLLGSIAPRITALYISLLHYGCYQRRSEDHRNEDQSYLRFPHLEYLQISYCENGNFSIATALITNSPNLRQLRFHDSGWTDERPKEVDAMLKALKGCRNLRSFFWDSEDNHVVQLQEPGFEELEYLEWFGFSDIDMCGLDSPLVFRVSVL
jgi:hypothetical protein